MAVNSHKRPLIDAWPHRASMSELSRRGTDPRIADLCYTPDSATDAVSRGIKNDKNNCVGTIDDGFFVVGKRNGITRWPAVRRVGDGGSSLTPGCGSAMTGK